MKYKNLLVNVGLLLVTLLIFFGSIELLLRITGIQRIKDYTPPIYQSSNNSTVSYELRPDIREKAFRSTIVTNNLGFRSPDIDPDKPLIAVLGDSITFGYGVENEEALPSRLQELIPTHNVLNAGTPGYHIAQEAALYKEKLAPLNPDALILIFYWNDFDRKTSWLDLDGTLRPEGWEESDNVCRPIENGVLSMLPGKCWLDTHSAIYKVIKKVANTRSGIKQRDEQRQDAKQKSVDESVSDEDLAYYDSHLKNLTNALPENSPKLFVIWPDAQMHQSTRPQLKRIAESHGFTTLDLYDHFGNEMETLSWDYVHPNSDSLKEAAKVVYDALQKIL